VPASFRIRAILNKAINRQGFWQGMTDNCAVTLPNLRRGLCP
jgi:hypothetical protein